MLLRNSKPRTWTLIMLMQTMWLIRCVVLSDANHKSHLLCIQKLWELQSRKNSHCKHKFKSVSVSLSITEHTPCDVRAWFGKPFECQLYLIKMVSPVHQTSSPPFATLTHTCICMHYKSAPLQSMWQFGKLSSISRSGCDRTHWFDLYLCKSIIDNRVRLHCLFVLLNQKLIPFDACCDVIFLLIQNC